eukprot:TRINITY_DN3920_c0_g1_i1.p1 TRINITY_DN3920_c0_g1~~TRINITY_DN3920_c0_g1_i1.p1  ORF type:complete len:181 (-),score=17.90 TRINITY_DN3920_c0_g1_i1:45-536(-)
MGFFDIIGRIVLLAVGVEHFYFFYLETFTWLSAKTRKAFGMSENYAKITRDLAANQGVYNAFIGLGCLWGVFAGDSEYALSLSTFFSFCVVIAAFVGGITVGKKIVILQGSPALVSLLVGLLRGGSFLAFLVGGALYGAGLVLAGKYSSRLDARPLIVADAKE